MDKEVCVWERIYIKWNIIQPCCFCCPKSFQLCPTLCDPIDGSLPGSPVPGILQARTLEWVAISFSNAWKWKVKVKSLIVSDSSRPHGLQPTRVLCPWDFPGKSTGVDSAMRREEILPFAIQIELEGIMLSEISPTEKDKYCMPWLICEF